MNQAPLFPDKEKLPKEQLSKLMEAGENYLRHLAGYVLASTQAGYDDARSHLPHARQRLLDVLEEIGK